MHEGERRYKQETKGEALGVEKPTLMPPGSASRLADPSTEVVYLDPPDLEFPVGMKLLRKVAPDQRHPVATPVISSLKSLWRDSWGPRLEYILHNAILALLDYDQATQLGVGCGPLIGSVSFEPVERPLRFRNCGSPFSKPPGLTPDPILGPRPSAYRGC